MVQLTEAPIDVAAVRAAVSRDEAGAVLIFEGVTRNHHDGREVLRLEAEVQLDLVAAVKSDFFFPVL